MNLLALDLSLTSTGWAAKHTDHRVASGTFCPNTLGVERLAAFDGWLGRMLDIWTPDLVVLEGYSFASQNSRAHSIGELGGVVKLQLHRRRQRFVECPPAVRAKLATGKGNAGKEQVLVEAVRRLGYDGHSNDEADALWLLHAALVRYGSAAAVVLPKAHREALASIEWPVEPLARAS